MADVVLRDVAKPTRTADLGRTLTPGQEPDLRLSRQGAPLEALPPGPLVHHLFSLITLLWKDENNRPWTNRKRYYDPDFRDITTDVVPAPQCDSLTPLNLAWSTYTIVEGVIVRDLYRSLNFDIFLGGNFIGNVQVGSTAPQRSNSTEMESIQAGISDSTNAPPVRTRFTGVSIPLHQFMLLHWGIMEDIWEMQAQEPLVMQTQRGEILKTRVFEGGTLLLFRIDLISFGSPQPVLTWGDLADRVLRMLQLPAFLQRWETLISEFYLGDTNVATAYIYRDITPQSSSSNMTGSTVSLPGMNASRELSALS